jgi:hypothetical protein
LWDAGAEVFAGAAELLEAGAGFLVFFTFLTFLVGAGAVAVWPELFCPAGVEAGDWAANVKGMAATARPIANSVFFISFLPCGLYCPLTTSCCGSPPGNSIACAG